MKKKTNGLIDCGKLLGRRINTFEVPDPRGLVQRKQSIQAAINKSLERSLIFRLSFSEPNFIMPTLHQFDYIFAVGMIFAFLDAWNIGMLSSSSNHEHA
jgi:hypothetical protein